MKTLKELEKILVEAVGDSYPLDPYYEECSEHGAFSGWATETFVYAGKNEDLEKHGIEFLGQSDTEYGCFMAFKYTQTGQIFGWEDEYCSWSEANCSLKFLKPVEKIIYEEDK